MARVQARTAPHRGWFKGGPFDRGHIIAKRLGGSGTDPKNIFAQCKAVNRGDMRVFEDKVAKAVQAGETVYYAVSLQYLGRPMPDMVSAFFAGSKGAAGQAFFFNYC